LNESHSRVARQYRAESQPDYLKAEAGKLPEKVVDVMEKVVEEFFGKMF